MLDEMAMLDVAIEEAKRSLGEGGIPIGAAIFTTDELGVELIDLASDECIEMMASFMTANPALWAEDGGRT